LGPIPFFRSKFCNYTFIYNRSVITDNVIIRLL
jgi:hypothetical protein